MKTVTLKTYLITAICFISGSILAGEPSARPSGKSILFEPYVGVEIGEFEQAKDYETSDDTTKFGDSTSYLAGIRLGRQSTWAFWAIDLLQTRGTFKAYETPSSSVQKKYDATLGAAGLVIGMDVSFIPRIWIGYYPYHQLRLKGEGEDNKYSGTAYKVGFGFSSGSWVNINFEYILHAFSKENGSGYPYAITENDETVNLGEFKYSSYLLTISFPFSLAL